MISNSISARSRLGERMRIVGTLALALLAGPIVASASDHDDGENSFKARNLNITDVYAFREDWQDTAGNADNLILIMNTNPRSLAQQQYVFNTRASYQFHLSRVDDDDKTKAPTGSDDVQIKFTFGVPDAVGKQSITMELVVKGKRLYSQKMGATTTLAESAAGTPVVNSIKIGSSAVKVFAGLREDPFFFDVERYFRVRSLLATGRNTLGSGPTQGAPNPFRSDATAVDFTVGYNVNSIVVSVPRSLIQRAAAQNVFDVWTTINLPERLAVAQRQGPPGTDSESQVERLARPAINEGLVLSDRRLNRWNKIGPRDDLSTNNQPVLAEAAAVLTAVNDYGKKNGLKPPGVDVVVAGFLPDVMRIDTSKSLAINKAAYNGDFVTVRGSTPAPMLTGGRKLEDDVVDITLSYLLNGDPTGASVKDGVSYSGGTTCQTAGQGSVGNSGHRCLHGQQTRLGSASFPFLAMPN